MTIFIDMDEVIADTYGAHIELYNKEFGANLTAEQCMGSEVWQNVPPEHQKNVQKHATREGFFINLKPIANSQYIVREISRKYEVYIASAAMQFPNSLREKSEWLDMHFPFLDWRKRILCGDKDILRGDILIDDRSYNLKAFTGQPLLFTSPHNIHTNGFERVNNWFEVADKLL